MAGFLDTLSTDLRAVTDAATQAYIVKKFLPTPAASVPPAATAAPAAAASAASFVPAVKPAGVSSLSPSMLLGFGVVLVLVVGVVALRRRR